MKDGKHVILCVDDDPDILSVLTTLLEANGYAPVTAGSGADGLRLYDKVKPDFIIVDLMMETIDAGTQLVKDLRAKAGNAPIYMLSSVGGEMSQTIDPESLGLDGMIQKPVRPNDLLAILKRRLNR